jgi:hypothetical protein
MSRNSSFQLERAVGQLEEAAWRDRCRAVQREAGAGETGVHKLVVHAGYELKCSYGSEQEEADELHARHERVVSYVEAKLEVVVAELVCSSGVLLLSSLNADVVFFCGTVWRSSYAA